MNLQPIKDYIEGINHKIIWLLLAGFCGSIIGLGINKDADITITRRILYIFGGVCCSFFLAGPIAKHFGLSDPGEISAIGFCVSMFWQQIVNKLSSSIEGFNLPFLGGK